MKQRLCFIGVRSLSAKALLGLFGASLLLFVPAVCRAGTFTILNAGVTLTGDQNRGFYAYVDSVNPLQIDWGIYEQQFSNPMQASWAWTYSSPSNGGDWIGYYTPIWLVSWTPAPGESTPPDTSAVLSTKLRVAGYQQAQGYQRVGSDVCELRTLVDLGIACGVFDAVLMDQIGGNPLKPGVNMLEQEATPTLYSTTYANWAPMVGSTSAGGYALAGPLGGPGWFQYQGQWLIYLSTNQLEMKYHFYQYNCPSNGTIYGTMLNKIKADAKAKIVSINGQQMDTPYPDNGIWP